jgi:hypothetical protein
LPAAARERARVSAKSLAVKGIAAVDLALLVLPPATLALFVTAHLAIVTRLFGQPPRWRAPVALLVPPLAFFWGKKAEMTGLCRLWLGALVAYAVCLALALTS